MKILIYIHKVLFMDVNQIIELEKKYQEKLNSLITSDLFISDLKNIETEIKQNYNLLKETFKIKQKFTSALERILSIRVPQMLNFEHAFPLPISSDVALMNDEVVIWIDAKSYDRHGNAGDEESIVIGINQLTSVLSHKKIKINSISGEDFIFPGFNIHPEILKGFPDAIYQEKPILSFVISLWCYDNGNDVDLKKIGVACIPHFLVYKQAYEKEILANTKSYEYYGASFSNNEILKPYDLFDFPERFKIVDYQNGIELNRLPEEVSPDNVGGLRSIALVDLENYNQRLQFYENLYLIRKYKGGKWRVTDTPGGFRISSKKLIKEQMVNGILFSNNWRIEKLNL